MASEEKVIQGTTLAIINGSGMVKMSAKKEYLKKFEFQQLKLCQQISVLEPFEIPSWDQMADNDQTLLSFLMKQQNQSMMTNDSMLFDFKAPLELEVVFLRDSQT